MSGLEDSKRPCTLEQALNFVRQFDALLRPKGFHAGLIGGTLLKGASEKDIDVVVLPLRLDQNVSIEDCAAAAMWKLEYRECASARMLVGRPGRDRAHVSTWLSDDDAFRVDLFLARNVEVP